MTALEFDVFYRAEFAGLVVLATAALGQRSGADDIVQEAMFDALRRWDRVGAYDNPRAWLRKVIVQRAMKVTRKRSNERLAHLRSIPRTSSGPTTTVIEPSLLEHLRALPPQQRAAIALHYLEDVSVRDIASLLGIAEGTVKAHLYKARASLVERIRVAGTDPLGGPTGDHAEQEGSR